MIRRIANIIFSSHGRVGTAWRFLLGVAIPIGLLWLDPIAFGPDSMFGAFSPPAYMAMSLSMAAFLTQLLPWRPPQFVSQMLSGAILAGSLFAGAIGLMILPLSIVAIQLDGYGLLGFYPFFVSFLYFRCARSAFAATTAESRATNWLALSLAFAGLLLTVAIPVLSMLAADHELGRLIAIARRGADFDNVNWKCERYLTWCSDSDKIVREYGRAPAGLQRQALAVLFRQLTGHDADQRLHNLAVLD